VRLLATGLVAGFAALLLPSPAFATDGPSVDRTLTDPRITESSGLAASARHHGVLWTHNDSGDSARIFAIDPDGRTAAVYTLAGQQARDWEAIAPGRDDAGNPALFIGDIGDNSASRTRGILVHRVTEPSRLRNGTLRPTSYRLHYPDGPQDAETLLVDPRTNRLYIVTKGLLGGGIYAAPTRLSTTGPNILERIADVPSLITDGAFLPDGRFVLRDYGDAYVYARPGQLVEEVELPEQPQGESLTVTPDGGALLVGSEGERSQVWRVPLPHPGSASASPQPGTAPRGDPADEEWIGRYSPAALAAGAASAVIALGAAGWCVHGWRRRRRRPAGR
jgi:hypothetical protein